MPSIKVLEREDVRKERRLLPQEVLAKHFPNLIKTQTLAVSVLCGYQYFMDTEKENHKTDKTDTGKGVAEKTVGETAIGGRWKRVGDKNNQNVRVKLPNKTYDQ